MNNTCSNSNTLKIWMLRNGIRQVDIQRSLGYANPKTVWATIAGRECNRRVLSWLLDAGCPARLLAIPDDMKGQ